MRPLNRKLFRIAMIKHLNRSFSVIRNAFNLLPWAIALMCLAPATVLAESGQVKAGSEHYSEPPDAVVRLLTASPPPQPLVHASSGQVALLFREPAVKLERLARPFLGLAGYQFEPRSRTSGTDPLVQTVELIDIATVTSSPVVWRPKGDALLDHIRFSPDGQLLSALAIYPQGAAKLVLFDIAQRKERVLKVPVNAAWGRPCAWAGLDALLCRVLPEQASTLPPEKAAPARMEHSGGAAPTRTYSNLLHNSYEDALFEHYFTAELARVSVNGKYQRYPQTRGLLYGFEPSADGDKAIITRIQGPYSRLVPARQFPQSVEIWDLAAGERIYQSAASGFGLESSATQFGEPDRISWKPGTEPVIGYLDRVQSAAGKTRHRWLSIDAPFETPEVIAISDTPIDEFGWTTAGTPYFSSTSEKDGIIKVYMIFDQGPQLIWQGETNSRYDNPGYALSLNGDQGPPLEIDGRIFLAGDGLGPKGPSPFLEAFNFESGDSEILFRADPGVYEQVLAVVDPDIPLLITSRETETTAPNLYKIEAGKRMPLRPFANPYPDLEHVERRVVSYSRNDGVALSGTLYTPGSWDGKTPLPTLIWIYPYEFSDREHAEQLDVRAFRYHGVKGPSPLAAVLEGYAVLVNPTVPIVHEGGGMNDDYLEQLVASAEAAIDHLAAIGVTDADRVAVGGRSYGAFSSANLLVHSRRFATAIAMSGAYNRTLTPFGFQHEKRSFWDATDLYTSISPFFHANEIEAPILLVHGAEDPNPGTPPLQAQRFFHALVGEGVDVRYVQLPYEGHHYRARESILDAANEMILWLYRTIGSPQQKSSALKQDLPVAD